MMYLLAIILPPVAVLFCGKPIAAIGNIVLTLFFWLPGAIHALMVVSTHNAEKRQEKLIRAMRDNTLAAASARK